MVKRPRKKLLGDDPLAWMKEEEGEQKITEPPKTGKSRPAGKTKVKDKSTVSVEPEITKPAVKTGRKKAEKNLLVLESHIRVDSALDLYDKMNSNLDVSQDIVIDASQVEEIDTAILQLLSSLALSLDKAGHNLILKKPSSEFIDRIKLLGLEPVLGNEKIFK